MLGWAALSKQVYERFEHMVGLMCRLLPILASQSWLASSRILTSALGSVLGGACHEHWSRLQPPLLSGQS